MCPEIVEADKNKKRSAKKVAISVCIAALSLICFAVLVICIFAVYRRIPGLKRLDELEVDYYTIAVTCYDGEKIRSVRPKSRSREESLEILDSIQRFVSLRGRRVYNWNKDKITYPIYAVTIMPMKFKSEVYIPGETVVWSNGYLFTASGEVYKCDPDFKSYLEADENDYVVEAEMDSISKTRTFRPIWYANSIWNKDMLVPFDLNEEEIAEGVKAEVVEISERAGFPLLTIKLKNTGDSTWYYEDNSLFVGMLVVVDGKLYRLVHDPSVDDDIRTIPGYDNPLPSGSKDSVEISLGYFGTLPPGNYKIVIYGQDNEGYKYALADYKIS